MRRKEHHRRKQEDPRLNEKGGIDVTGKNEMIFVRNYHQKILEQDWYYLKTRIWQLEKERNNIVKIKNESEKLKKNIEKHMEERDRAFTNLQNLLNKEQEYEDKMLSKTLEGMQAKGNVTVKQRLKDVDIDTLQYGSVEQYKRLYPGFGEEIFKNAKILNEKEKEIRHAQEAFHQAVSNYNSLLATIDVNIQKAEDNFKKYDDDKKKADSERESCRFYKSILYKVASMKTKTLLDFDTSSHDLRKFRNDLDIISKSISELSPISN